MSNVNIPKKVVTGLAQWMGVNSLLRFHNRERLLILCYHGVVHDKEATDPYLYRNAVCLSEFVSQLKILRRWFCPISGQDLIHSIMTSTPLPRNSVLLTFDDGFRNNLTVAAPALLEHKIPAIFLITTDSIDTGRPIWPLELDLLILSLHESVRLPFPDGKEIRVLSSDQTERIQIANEVRSLCKKLSNEQRHEYINQIRNLDQSHPDQHHELLEFMNWDEVRELRKIGFEIGSHTVSHPILSKAGFEEIVRELNESKKKIENEINQPCDWLAYPNGGKDDYSPVVLEQADIAGYKIGFALPECRCTKQLDRRLELARLCISNGMTDLDFKSRVSGFYELTQQLASR